MRMTLLPCIQVMRGKKIRKGRWEQGKWEGTVWNVDRRQGDKDKLVSNKSIVVTKRETNADMQLGRISHYRILFGVKMCSMKIF